MTQDLSLVQINVDNNLNGNFTALGDAVNSKADLNGSSVQKFAVADAVQSLHAVNKGQLDASVTDLNSQIADTNTALGTETSRAETAENTIKVNLSAFENATQSALDLKADEIYVDSHLSTKVDKVFGKGLSTNDLTDSLKSNYDLAYIEAHTHSNKAALDFVNGINTGDQDLSGFVTKITKINGHTLFSDVTLSASDVGAVDAADTAVTKQGNSFNHASQLIKTNAAAQYPALDGCLITNLSQSQITGLTTSSDPTFHDITTKSISNSDTSGGFLVCWSTNNTTSSAYGGSIFLQRDFGGLACPAGYLAGAIYCKLYDGTTYPTNTRIAGTATENQDSTHHGCSIYFEITKIAQTGRTPVMFFDPSTGNLLPGTDNTFNLGQSGVRWAQVWAANGTIQTSDIRQKEQITSLSQDSRLDSFFDQLNPVSYKWKDYTDKIKSYETDENGQDVEVEQDNPHTFKRLHHGMIAQEVEQAMNSCGITSEEFAGLIIDEKTEEYGLRYEEFIPILIKQVQDLKKEIKELKSKN